MEVGIPNGQGLIGDALRNLERISVCSAAESPLAAASLSPRLSENKGVRVFILAWNIGLRNIVQTISFGLNKSDAARHPVQLARSSNGRRTKDISDLP